jgi:hypothetical protein
MTAGNRTNKRQLTVSEMRRLFGEPDTRTHDSRQNVNRFLAELYHINGAELQCMPLWELETKGSGST